MRIPMIEEQEPCAPPVANNMTLLSDCQQYGEALARKILSTKIAVVIAAQAGPGGAALAVHEIGACWW
jgi:hypothetical protein